MDRIVATGYGRKLLADALNGELPVTTITEIQAYALGAHHLYPETRTILDIGGQDTKVISLSGQGKVAKFEMNDRCAAGTGKFLEFMAAALQIPIESFGDYALQADRRIKISQHVHRICRKRGHLARGPGRATGKHRPGVALGHRAAHSFHVGPSREGISPDVCRGGGP